MAFVYRDMRIRNANKATPVPPAYRAYIFLYSAILIGCPNDRYKVIVAHSLQSANQRLKEFCEEEGLSPLDFMYLGDDDFEIIYPNNMIR